MLFCLIFTLSFDVLLSVGIGPFTLRIANLFALLIFVIVISERLFKGRLNFVLDTSITIPAFFLLFFAVVSLYQSLNLEKSVGYLIWFIFDIVVVYLGTANFFSSNSSLLKAGIKMHVIAGALIAFFGLFQLFGTALGIQGLTFERTQWFLPGIPRISAFSYEPSYFAFFVLEILAIVVVFWTQGSLLFKRWVMIPIFLVLVLALFFSTSRTAWAGLFVLYLYALFQVTLKRDLRKRRFLWFLGGTILLLFCAAMFIILYLPSEYFSKLGTIFLMAFNFSEVSSTAPRLQSMAQAFQVFLRSPLIGVGIGGYGAYVVNELGVWGDPFKIVPSNMWMEVLAETGVLGFGALFWLVFSFWRGMKKTQKLVLNEFWRTAVEAYKVSVLIIFLIAFQFAQTLYRMDVWFLLGMAIAVKRIASSTAGSDVKNEF